MALGAKRGQVLRLVLRQGMVMTAIGIVLGLIGAAAGTRYLRGLLFGLVPLDPTTFAAVARPSLASPLSHRTCQLAAPLKWIRWWHYEWTSRSRREVSSR